MIMVDQTGIEPNTASLRNCYAKGARRAGQGRASGEPQCSERTLDAPKRSRKMVGRSDADFALQKTRLISAGQDSNQIGKYAIRLVHSLDSVAAQMRISESAASLIARLCGTTMSPGLVLDRVNSPKWVGIVVWSWVTRMRSSCAAMANTAASSTPARPAAVAVRKSISGVLQRPRNNDLIEVGVGLEPDKHSARVWSLPLGVGQLLVEHRIGLTARLTLGTKVTLPSLHVAVHFLAVRQIERDGPVHLLEIQYRKGLRNGFGRGSGHERVHDGVQGHTRARHHVTAVPLLDVS